MLDDYTFSGLRRTVELLCGDRNRSIEFLSRSGPQRHRNMGVRWPAAANRTRLAGYPPTHLWRRRRHSCDRREGPPALLQGPRSKRHWYLGLWRNGDLFYYRDEARAGTARWAFGGAPQKIESGWN